MKQVFIPAQPDVIGCCQIWMEEKRENLEITLGFN